MMLGRISCNSAKGKKLYNWNVSLVWNQWKIKWNTIVNSYNQNEENNSMVWYTPNINKSFNIPIWYTSNNGAHEAYNFWTLMQTKFFITHSRIMFKDVDNVLWQELMLTVFYDRCWSFVEDTRVNKQHRLYLIMCNEDVTKRDMYSYSLSEEIH